MWGASDVNSAGKTIEAGLPNITGKVSRNGYGPIRSESNGQGCFIVAEPGAGLMGESYTNGRTLEFDASYSNPIYGNSTTVQPPAFTVNIWQRTA